MAHDFDYLQASADASETYNVGAGKIRVGGYVMLKGRPCRVNKVHCVQNGKHGKTKCHFTGIDVFTGARKEEIIASHESADVPFVAKHDFTCMSLDSDGYLSILDNETYETRQDLRVPDKNKELSERIRALLEAERDFAVTILRACGTELVVDASSGKTNGK